MKLLYQQQLPAALRGLKVDFSEISHSLSTYLYLPRYLSDWKLPIFPMK